jgi:glycosidase
MSGTPEWTQDAVFYQVFVDRFARSGRVEAPGALEPWDAAPTPHGYKGGDLYGIADRLDHLSELGVNALYLTPIFTSASNHRYHTHDYGAVDPLLGGDAALDHLLLRCHARGIRVVLDAVLNHSGRGFFPFHDVLENGAASPYLDWFDVSGFPLNAYGPGRPRYACWRGIPALPKLNTENPKVRKFLCDVVERWAWRGIDGWRFDTPEEITTPGFWEEVRASAKAVDPDLYLVGEIWKDASAWLGERFDGAMGYWLGGHTLVYAAQERFRFAITKDEYPIVREPVDALAYGDHVEALMARYTPEQARANLNLYGSHDTARAMTMVSSDRRSVELAALLLLTMPGAPCIYYGDEIGMEGEDDPDCRRGFPWALPDTWDHALLATFRSLVALRRAHVATRRGTYRRLAEDRFVYAFAMEHAQEVLFIATNATDAAAAIEVRETVGVAERVHGAGELTSTPDGARIAMPPRSGAVWKVRAAG